jgi:hypothetical protein
MHYVALDHDRRPPTERASPRIGPPARGFLFRTAPQLGFGRDRGRPSRRIRPMTTISITAEAFAAIEAAFPGDWRTDIRPDGKGGYLLTLPDGMIDLLKTIRSPSESYSDVIIRIARGAASPW